MIAGRCTRDTIDVAGAKVDRHQHRVWTADADGTVRRVRHTRRTKSPPRTRSRTSGTPEVPLPIMVLQTAGDLAAGR
jgi:hypothetical protein